MYNNFAAFLEALVGEAPSERDGGRSGRTGGCGTSSSEEESDAAGSMVVSGAEPVVAAAVAVAVVVVLALRGGLVGGLDGGTLTVLVRVVELFLPVGMGKYCLDLRAGMAGGAFRRVRTGADGTCFMDVGRRCCLVVSCSSTTLFLVLK